MKYRASIGKKFITIIPKPKSHILKGLRVYLQDVNDNYTTPMLIYTDIIKGKPRYSYSHAILPHQKVIRVEINDSSR
jgi:hypothetical protein